MKGVGLGGMVERGNFQHSFGNTIKSLLSSCKQKGKLKPFFPFAPPTLALTFSLSLARPLAPCLLSMALVLFSIVR